VLLFTGHMIDAPGRAVPRFPPDKVEIAKQKIAEAVAGDNSLQVGLLTVLREVRVVAIFCSTRFVKRWVFRLRSILPCRATFISANL
jgi:hypothetical protein